MSVLRYGRVLGMVVILVLAATIQGESDTLVSPSPTGTVTWLPFPTNHPFVGGADGTPVTQLSTSNFIIQYNLATSTNGTSPGAPDWDAAMIYWTPWATNASWGYDLSSITTFVFGVRGTALGLTTEFQSSDGAKTFVSLFPITTNMQYYHINKSSITNDITKMSVISFTAHYDDVGPIKSGTVEVVVQGLSTNFPDSRPTIYPSPTGNVTLLRGEPRVTGVDTTTVTQLSTSNFIIQYNLATSTNGTSPGAPDWDAAMIYWTGFSPTNLSSITTFVFAVKGTANKVQVEFESANATNKAIMLLESVTNTLQYYHIPASRIESNILKNTKVISFVTLYDDVGPVKTGTVEVVVRGLKFDMIVTNINPLTTGDVTWLPDSPWVSGVNTTAVTQLSTSNFVVNYNLATNGSTGGTFPGEPDWDAAMIYWDDFGEKNLSSITTFVFKVRGTAEKVKVEFESTNAFKTAAVLQGVNSTWQYYHIPASSIPSNNLKIMKVISFVAVYEDVGPVKTGTFEVVVHGLTYWPPAFITNGPATVLPNYPKVIRLGGANDDTVVANTTNVITVTYNVSSEYAGATIQYGTRGTNDSQNLSRYTNLIFGLLGDTKNVKIEFLDAFNNRATFLCTNVVSLVTNYYAIATTEINKMADIAHISAISFVVDRGLVAGGSLAGTLRIVSGGLYAEWFLNGTNTGPVTVLPNYPQVIPVGGANPYTVVTSTTNLIDVTYSFVSTGGWSGATILYDNYGTTNINESTGPLQLYQSCLWTLGRSGSATHDLEEGPG